jgi:hypothetical protein
MTEEKNDDEEGDDHEDEEESEQESDEDESSASEEENDYSILFPFFLLFYVFLTICLCKKLTVNQEFKNCILLDISLKINI